MEIWGKEIEMKDSEHFDFSKLTKKELIHLLVLIEQTSGTKAIGKAMWETQFGVGCCRGCTGIHKKDIYKI